MVRMKAMLVSLTLLASTALLAQAAPPNALDKLIREKSPVIAITHVQLLDGTGAAALSDQTVVFDHGTITAVGASASTATPAAAKVIDGTGKTLLPGLVGMHEHLFYSGPSGEQRVFIEQPFSFPQLYLASGVTTARTTGAMEPYADFNIKQQVDAGKLAGPEFFLTTPYLDGKPTIIPQMHEVTSPEEAREFVRYWHSVGFTSVKAYFSIHADELKAGIDEAHKLGMKVTGHICTVGYLQAAELGIDNPEHGPFGAPDVDFYSGKKPESCADAPGQIFRDITAKGDPNGALAKQTIDALIAHHVALTSTLAVFEGGLRPPMKWMMSRAYALMSDAEWSNVMTDRAFESAQNEREQMTLSKEMAFELAFFKAGGTMLAGCDPTGDGHIPAGLGDQREMELLIEEGLTPAQAVQVYTSNGAKFLGIADRVGTIAVGKQADLILLQGDFVKDPTAIEHPEVVFKKGIGYDSQAIYDSLRGQVGLR